MQKTVVKSLYKINKRDNVDEFDDKRKNLVKFLSLWVASEFTLKKTYSDV